MSEAANNIFLFQHRIIEQITEAFATMPVVILVGKAASGKSIIGEAISLEGYTKHILKGKIDYRFEDLGVFKRSALFSKTRKVRSPIVNVATIISSFFEKEAIVGGISGLMDTVFAADEEYLIQKLKSSNSLLVIDHLNEYDQQSLTMILSLKKWLEKESYSGLKILMICDPSDDSVKAEHSKENCVRVGSLAPEDLHRLGLGGKPEDYQDIPIKELISIKQTPGKSTHMFREKEFKQVISNLNESDQVILRTILHYRNISRERWIDIQSVQNHLWQNRIYNSLERILRLNELHLIEISEQKQYVGLNENFRLWYERQETHSIDTEQCYIYLEYLENSAPFLYYEKYLNYVLIGNKELALKNAVLSYSLFMRERGGFSVTNHLLEYVKELGGSEFHMTLKNIYENYNKNNYYHAYYLADKFLEEAGRNPYAFNDEIVAEISCIRALTLARSINRTDQTRDIRESDIVGMEHILKGIKEINLDLATRLQEAILNLCTDIVQNTTDYIERARNLYEELYQTYQKQISRTSPKYVEFWQIKMAVLLSKMKSVMAVDHGLNPVPVLQRAHLVFNQIKKDYPVYYLRTTCNYAGASYWRGEYEEALKVLDEAIHFIEDRKQNEIWGIIYQLRTMIQVVHQNGCANAVNYYGETIWQNARIRNKMHEGYICISNYSLFLLSLQTQTSMERAREYLQTALNTINARKLNVDEYDCYVLKTNLGVVNYLLGDCSSAIQLEKECKTLIEAGYIKYLDLVQLKERHILLMELYRTPCSDQTVLSLLGEDQRKQYKSGHDSKNYRRLGFFSDIEYWSN